MRSRESVRLATRGSTLARRQAAEIQAALEDRRHEVELVEVETVGDRVTDELIQDLGKTGAFVRAVDEVVLAGEADAAVHSMKDVPTDTPEDMVFAAVPPRASAGDALVTPDGSTLDELPAGAVVGTSSLRRKAQVLARRPDLEVEPLRGNVDTRLEKLLAPHMQAKHEARLDAEDEYQEKRQRAEKRVDSDPSSVEREYERTVEEWFDSLNELERSSMERDVDVEYDAIVLARAGLERSGLAHDVPLVDLDVNEHVPAPGQGALAVTAVEGDLADTLHDVLDHPRSRVETTVERIVLEELGGGCIAPLGVHAFVKGETVRAEVQVFSEDGSESVTEGRDLPADDYAAAARALADDLDAAGASDLIEEAKRE
ncbi:hydroxymethylbilane synthase [Halocalculus aciditolerans]|uniref:Hydroxymethylbilane synthase n=1 Tax=Halocalculus aciditolerans TaxID=1383812 RepID=A0A830FF91_9EURY|nr:hydroxymethylbilane synthase [Halocalculus aciditolerans]GGL47456.1 porphobilinogen deaminase [Halocalculus aciditolerans]